MLAAHVACDQAEASAQQCYLPSTQHTGSLDTAQGDISLFSQHLRGWSQELPQT
jgi:hypothetical protein